MALGFGAQNLVKDFIAGLFMLLEDQYGVGDLVDVGEASGMVEAVGLRITTIRDARGVLWYIRNGEIIRVGNKSQGWALVVVDVPVGSPASRRPPRYCGPRPPRGGGPGVAPDLSERPRCSGSNRSRSTARSPDDREDHRGRQWRWAGNYVAGSPRR